MQPIIPCFQIAVLRLRKYFWLFPVFPQCCKCCPSNLVSQFSKPYSNGHSVLFIIIYLSIWSEVKEGSKGRQESVFQLTMVNFGLEILRVSEIRGAEPAFWDTGDHRSQPKDEFWPVHERSYITSLSVTGLKGSPSSWVLHFHAVLQHKNSLKIDFKCSLVNCLTPTLTILVGELKWAKPSSSLKNITKQWACFQAPAPCTGSRLNEIMLCIFIHSLMRYLPITGQ